MIGNLETFFGAASKQKYSRQKDYPEWSGWCYQDGGAKKGSENVHVAGYDIGLEPFPDVLLVPFHGKFRADSFWMGPKVSLGSNTEVKVGRKVPTMMENKTTL